jgi:hypothetical protein
VPQWFGPNAHAGKNMVFYMYKLFGGDWNHGILNDFPIQLGISSSQLTNSYFSEGYIGIPTTSKWL